MPIARPQRLPGRSHPADGCFQAGLRGPRCQSLAGKHILELNHFVLKVLFLMLNEITVIVDCFSPFSFLLTKQPRNASLSYFQFISCPIQLMTRCVLPSRHCHVALLVSVATRTPWDPHWNLRHLHLSPKCVPTKGPSSHHLGSQHWKSLPLRLTHTERCVSPLTFP